MDNHKVNNSNKSRIAPSRRKSIKKLNFERINNFTKRTPKW